METGASDPTVAQVACLIPISNSQPNSDPRPLPPTDIPQPDPLPQGVGNDNRQEVLESLVSTAGVTEIITTSSDAVITRTAPSAPSSEPQTPENLISASLGDNHGHEGSLIPPPPADPLSIPQKPTTKDGPRSIEPAIQLRTSRSFKRDSGLAVGESPTSSTPSPAFAVPVATPTNTNAVAAAAAASPPPRYIKRYAPSLVGAASIGGVSVAPSTLTPEDELASRRVRSLYDSGSLSDRQSSYSRRGADSDAGSMVVPGGRTKRLSKGIRNSWVITDEEGELAPEMTTRALREEEEGETSSREQTEGHAAGERAARDDSLELPEQEAVLLAGGVEDWENVEGKDVDRYGFINPSNLGPGQQGRFSTIQTQGPPPKRKRRPIKTLINPFDSEKPQEMLQSPLEWEQEEMREKEIERAKKWKAMAISMSSTKSSKWRRTKGVEKPIADGEGMNWRFATRDPKLISRTWKGIPDCWRAAAWHSFLTASAERKGDCISDNDLREIYKELVELGSADDVQIDLDVPRTISSHIMFRRRYRGGQRLLFRVLHALALHFPLVGYVQGMAALAATLLCYYDEETCFIMLVRLWELRGLGRLYEAGFGGLVAALDEFEKKWLKGGVVGQHLEALGISPMVYGTKWYLTLFNYSIPFPAQLRVWDVFMLLGDQDIATGFHGLAPSPGLGHHHPHHSHHRFHFGSHKSLTSEALAAPNSPLNAQQSQNQNQGFEGTLDIIHATSMALIDGMKDVILQSDFENAMKALTGWIPVKDEELLMKVARSEWRARRKRWHFEFGRRNSLGGERVRGGSGGLHMGWGNKSMIMTTGGGGGSGEGVEGLGLRGGGVGGGATTTTTTTTTTVNTSTTNSPAVSQRRR